MTQPGGVEVVAARPDDAAAIRALPGLGGSTRRLLDLDLIRDDRCCLVARTADGPAGWAPGEQPAGWAPGEKPAGWAPGEGGAGWAPGAGKVVGFAMGLVQLGEAHVLDIAVAIEQRGRGVGRLLLQALLDRVRERGATAVTLEVRRSNVAALALYRQLGFTVEGERPRYYPDGEDALLMWRRDPGARD